MTMNCLASSRIRVTKEFGNFIDLAPDRRLDSPAHVRVPGGVAEVKRRLSEGTFAGIEPRLDPGWHSLGAVVDVQTIESVDEASRRHDRREKTRDHTKTD